MTMRSTDAAPLEYYYQVLIGRAMATFAVVSVIAVPILGCGRERSGPAPALPTPPETPAVASAPHVVPTVRSPEVSSAKREALARAIADERRGKVPVALTKAELRAPMHQFVPLLGECYEHAQALDPTIGGVVNTDLTIDSEPDQGTVFAVRGFDTTGPLGQSSTFRDCVRTTVAAIVLPPIASGGRAEVTYPITFAPAPPDNLRRGIVDEAKEAAAAGRWDDALAKAKRGLELTSLDGTYRRVLIEVAGVAACHLKREAEARHYDALASATFEPEIRAACARDAGIDLSR